MRELDLLEEKALDEFERVIPILIGFLVMLTVIGVTVGVTRPATGQLFAPFTQALPKSVRVGTTSTLVLPANLGRKYASFVNDSLEVIYLSLGMEALPGEGIRLNPEGGWFEINMTNLYLGSVYAVSTGEGNLSIVEGF